jgi:hypothetical protein
LSYLFAALVGHQAVYDSTVAAIPFLAHLAARANLTDARRAQLVLLLLAIALASNPQTLRGHGITDDEYLRLAREARETLGQFVNIFRELQADAGTKYGRYARDLVRELASEIEPAARCFSCGAVVRTSRAKQCFQCGADWRQR